MSDSILQTNPMLLNPNAGQAGQQVAPLAAMTQPYAPMPKLDRVYHFVCTMLNHHMFRPDGKKLAFMFGVHATDDYHDVKYLASEIEGGNPFIRYATDLEVRAHNMRTDPKGTVAREITPQIEAAVRGKLEVELQQSLEERLSSIGVVLSDVQKEALKAANTLTTHVLQDPVAESAMSAELDAAKLAGVDILSTLRNALATKTGNATMVLQSDPAANSPLNRLQGIVGTDKLPNAAG